MPALNITTTMTIGGDLPVFRPGFGAMRLTGELSLRAGDYARLTETRGGMPTQHRHAIAVPLATEPGSAGGHDN